MNRSTTLLIAISILLLTGCNQSPTAEQLDPTNLKLADYEPKSIFVLEENHPTHAKYPVIDMHSHVYVETAEEVQKWVKTMDANNIEKVIVYTYSYGEEFDKIYDIYMSVAPDRFELWCGFDMSSWGTPDYPAKAVAELERCFKKGAKGIGELSDKGFGDKNSQKVKKPGLHYDADEFVPLFSKCAELGMPVNIHFADPIWMYEPMDNHNDGYMNAYNWKIDPTTPDLYDFDDLMASAENTIVKNPNTTFIFCHYINLSHDYERLGAFLDRNPNLWIDNSARFDEVAPTPRATKKFYEKYSDRILFGTDNDPEDSMYDHNWRIYETEDEHFYSHSYHWALYGLGLSDDILQKVYHDNALQLLNNR